MDYNKKLSDAYAKLNQRLKEKGIVLPTDDTGATHWNHVTQGMARVLLRRDFDSYEAAEVEEGSTLTLSEQADKFRKQFEKIMGPYELEVLILRYVYGMKFEEIKDEVGFGNVSAVKSVHKKALEKAKAKYVG